MGHVKDNRESETFHDREAPNVHNQVVITERAPSLGHENPEVTFTLDLVNGMANIPWRDELALLDIHYGARPPRLKKQIGLTTKERRNLDDLADFRNRA